MEICRILQAGITFWLCYETLWRVFWFLNIQQREDKWSSNESIFCPLYKGFRAWGRSGGDGCAALKACPVTALLLLGRGMKLSGVGNSQLNSAEFLVPIPPYSVQMADPRFHLFWWQILDFISSGVLGEGNSGILEGWVCHCHVGVCLSLFYANRLFKHPLLVI